jgi:hypothetical protein
MSREPWTSRRYNHLDKTLRLSVTVYPELAEILEREPPLKAAGRSKAYIAGAGCERNPPTLLILRSAGVF